MTAHRSKGLEFRDVVILDGDWGSASKGEDPDGPRRLFYVAMTRARSSLAILTTGEHPFAPPAGEACLWREMQPDLGGMPAVVPSYVPPDMKLVDLSWAGRLRAGAPELLAIAESRVGDPLTLHFEAGRWFLRDRQGRPVGRMARSFALPAGKVPGRVEIGAVLRWRKSDNDEEFQRHIRREEWETILPDMQFIAPPRGGGR